MKKIISLMIPIGLMVILFTIIILHTPASEASSGSQPKAGDSTKPEQTGPQWYDTAWNYRRPVVITNNGALIPWYQVLIKLDSSNFNFNLAKIDGGDLRFTHSDGTTDLKYWIESWNNPSQLAYVWVRVPSLAVGDTTIYLYYNNPAAISVSDGAATFDGFDGEWSPFTGAGFTQAGGTQIFQSSNEVDSPFSWFTISGTPTASSGYLTLAAGTGIKSNSTYQNYAFGIRANFGLGTGHEWAGFINGLSGQQTLIGDIPSDPGNLYLINYRNNYENILLPRVGGNDWHNEYHIYEVRWNSVQSMGDIDHGSSTALSTLSTPNIPLPVTLYSYTGSNAAFVVDWAYVRQYRNPEPSPMVSTEQGLVELMIKMKDTPDPLPRGGDLTYQITITNTSIIAAPGVIVTDTLPGSVQLFSAVSSQGICNGSMDIVCRLGAILPNSPATITISVVPTIGGLITNSVIVGSPGFELNMSNNVDQTVTLVDSTPPNVNWEKPVHNGQDYTTYGGWITLGASATDNDQVAWVEFLLYDHLGNNWISIGTDYTSPYQVQFETAVLIPNIRYQMFVRAADNAGNVSDPRYPLRAIYVQRTSMFFDYLAIVTR